MAASGRLRLLPKENERRSLFDSSESIVGFLQIHLSKLAMFTHRWDTVHLVALRIDRLGRG